MPETEKYLVFFLPISLWKVRQDLCRYVIESDISPNHPHAPRPFRASQSRLATDGIMCAHVFVHRTITTTTTGSAQKISNRKSRSPSNQTTHETRVTHERKKVRDGGVGATEVKLASSWFTIVIVGYSLRFSPLHRLLEYSFYDFSIYMLFASVWAVCMNAHVARKANAALCRARCARCV